MAKSINIFKSFDEQGKFHQQLMLQTTAIERFRNLYAMQQLTRLMHPPKDTERKIIIHKAAMEAMKLRFANK